MAKVKIRRTPETPDEINIHVFPVDNDGKEPDAVGLDVANASVEIDCDQATRLGLMLIQTAALVAAANEQRKQLTEAREEGEDEPAIILPLRIEH